MKKKFLLLLLACVCVAGFFACAKTAENRLESVSMTLSYNEETGVVSWNAASGADKYEVEVLMRYAEEPDRYETEDTNYALVLKKGVSLVSVRALAEGSEVGFGSVIVTLETDFGAPSAPDGIEYDKVTGKLCWNPVEGATEYKVTAKKLIGEEEYISINTREPNVSLDITAGVYEFGIVAIDADGRESLPSVEEWASFTDADLQKELGGGMYNLLNFEDEKILELQGPSDYREWDTASLGEARVATTCELRELVYSEGEYGYTPIAVAESAVLEIGVASDEAVFAGVTFRLPKIIKFGTFYFDVFRACGSSCGVMVGDGNGNEVPIAVNWDDADSFRQWNTMSVTFSSLREKSPEFAGIREITFYGRSTKTGNFYFDNVRYDMINVGTLGENVAYDRVGRTLSWSEVQSAEYYEITVGNEKYTSQTNSVVLDKELSGGETTVTIKAVNGDSEREKSYIVEMPVFNEEKAGEKGTFVLADFTSGSYAAYLSGSPETTQNKETGELAVVYSATWENGGLTYNFPAAIDASDMQTLEIRFKGDGADSRLIIYLYDEQGRSCYVNLSTASTSQNVTFDTDGDFRVAIIDMQNLPDGKDNEFPDGKIGMLKSINFAARSTGEVVLGEIIYR